MGRAPVGKKAMTAAERQRRRRQRVRQITSPLERQFKVLLKKRDDLEREWWALPEGERRSNPELARFFGARHSKRRATKSLRPDQLNAEND